MLYTTLSRAEKYIPFRSARETLLYYFGKSEADNAPVSFADIMRVTSIETALLAAPGEPQHAKLWLGYALQQAKKVQHLMTDPRSVAALAVAEAHADGTATDQELAVARTEADAAMAASSASEMTYWAAAWAAVGACYGYPMVAARARSIATKGLGRTSMAEDFLELLNTHEALPGQEAKELK